ncbi:hypothetical protein R6Z07F_018165 [Ovis aries]
MSNLNSKTVCSVMTSYPYATPAGGLRPARGLSGTVAPNCTPGRGGPGGVPRVAPQAAAVADGESRVAVGAERGRRGGWRKQSPQLSVEEGGDSAGAVSRFSEEHFISTARERAWMLKLEETSVIIRLV